MWNEMAAVAHNFFPDFGQTLWNSGFCKRKLSTSDFKVTHQDPCNDVAYFVVFAEACFFAMDGRMGTMCEIMTTYTAGAWWVNNHA